MSESPDCGESPSPDNSRKYKSISPRKSSGYSSGESPSGESPKDTWSDPSKSVTPAKKSPTHEVTPPINKNSRYKI